MMGEIEVVNDKRTDAVDAASSESQLSSEAPQTKVRKLLLLFCFLFFLLLQSWRLEFTTLRDLRL